METLEQINNSEIVDKMKQNGVKLGTSLEITLTQDAACYDGYDSAGPDYYSKYSDKYSDYIKRPGYKLTGFLHEFDNNKLVLSNIFPIPHATIGATPIDYNVIESYKINK